MWCNFISFTFCHWGLLYSTVVSSYIRFKRDWHNLFGWTSCKGGGNLSCVTSITATISKYINMSLASPVWLNGNWKPGASIVWGLSLVMSWYWGPNTEVRDSWKHSVACTTDPRDRSVQGASHSPQTASRYSVVELTVHRNESPHQFQPNNLWQSKNMFYISNT